MKKTILIITGMLMTVAIANNAFASNCYCIGSKAYCSNSNSKTAPKPPVCHGSSSGSSNSGSSSHIDLGNLGSKAKKVSTLVGTVEGKPVFKITKK